MIYIANELLLKLTHLALVGVDGDGQLEWCGTREQWEMANCPSDCKVLDKADLIFEE
jgi:hypothetical protein